MKYIYFLLLNLLIFCFTQKTYSVVQWSGSSIENVIDENVVIKGDCQMPQNTMLYVQAHHANITISLDHDATIQANNTDNTNFLYGIYLEAYYPYVITVDISHTLTFKGAAGYLSQPLSIYVQGDGKIQFVFKDDSNAKVLFTSDANSGGVELWSVFSFISASDSGFKATPEITFETKRKGQVHFGPRSKWGYLVNTTYNLNATTTFIHKDSTNVGFGNFAKFGLQVVTL